MVSMKATPPRIRNQANEINMFTLPASPPRARTLYLIAFSVAVLITVLSAFGLDAFRKESHPDPTRGSFKATLIVFAGLTSFCLTVGTLVIGRWALWPRARTAFWSAQAAVFAAIGTFAFLSLLIPWLIFSYQASSNKDSTGMEGTSLPIGMVEPYFPSSFQRLEWFDESVQSTRFRELAIADSMLYMREGYVGFSSLVMTRIFPTEQEAYRETQSLVRKLQHDGYQLMPTPSTVRPAT